MSTTSDTCTTPPVRPAPSPLPVYRISPPAVISADCGALISSTSTGHQHTAHLSLSDADRDRYVAGPILGRLLVVCGACWDASEVTGR